MKRSLIAAILGIILPSFIYIYEINLFLIPYNVTAMMGFGWTWIFVSWTNFSGNYFGFYASDPRIFLFPGDWDGFNTGLNEAAIQANLFVQNFFSDGLNGNSNSISSYSLLFTLGLILAILGIILLLKNDQRAGALLLIAGLLGLAALLLFNQEVTDNIFISNTLPLPIGSVLLLLAGLFVFVDNKSQRRR